MKKIFVAIVCLCILSSVAFAQRSQRSPEEVAKETTEWMKRELKLKPEQETKVDSINLVFAHARAELIRRANGDIASIREDMRKLNALRAEEFEKHLTKEQMKAYNKAMEERQRNRGQGDRGDRRRNN